MASRASQDHAAYARRTGHYPTPFRCRQRGVPPSIVVLARQPFRISCDGRGDPPSLGLYIAPYIPQIPSTYLDAPPVEDSLFEAEDDLSEITLQLNAHEYSLFKEKGRERYNMWRNHNGMEQAKREIDLRIQAWYSAKAVEVEEGTKAAVAQAVALDWAGKIICSLATEAEVVKEGFDRYQEAFENSLLPWQRMNFIFRE